MSGTPEELAEDFWQNAQSDREHLREKIKDTIQACIAWNFPKTLGEGQTQLSWDEAADSILALSEKEERERIWAWGEGFCERHVIKDVPRKMGGGTIKLADRRRRRCRFCWEDLVKDTP